MGILVRALLTINVISRVMGTSSGYRTCFKSNVLCEQTQTQIYSRD